MKNRRVILLTNYLTPYRRVSFDHLSELLRMKDIKFQIWVMSKKVPGYDWKYEDLKSKGTRLLKEHSLLIKSRNYKIIINPDLLRLLKKTRPDLIILSGDYLAISNWATLIGKYIYNYIVFFWSESHLEEKNNHNIFMIMIREFLRTVFYNFPDGFLFPGIRAQQLIMKYRKRPAWLLQYPNLINDEVYRKTRYSITNEQINQFKAERGLSKNKFVFSCVARLSWEKGIFELLELFAKCNCKDRIVLLVAGEGREQGRLVTFAQKESLNVQFLGFCTQSDIIRMHSAADAFVLPSLADPNPLSVIEAIWCGLPLLLTKHVGNGPEVVKEGKNGYIIDYNDPEGAVDKIEKMVMADGNWLNEARKISRQIAEERFDSYKSSEKLVERIEEIIH